MGRYIPFLLLFTLIVNTTSHAFQIGFFESGMSIEEAGKISINKKDKNVSNTKISERAIHCTYKINNYEYALILQFTNKSRKLYMASLMDIKIENSQLLHKKFQVLNKYFLSSYGQPKIKKLEVSRFDRGKQETDYPDNYFYENNKDKIQLSYSSKIHSLSANIADQDIEKLEKSESPPMPCFNSIEEAQEYFKNQMLKQKQTI